MESVTCVLVVDDEPDTLEVLREALELQGYDVYPAAGAQQALDLARARRFDLALCDLYLEKMDGLEFTRAVVKMHPQMPVVLMTTFGDTAASRDALAAGASDFVTKPLDIATLPFVVENNIQRKAIETQRLSMERASVLFKAIKALAAAIDAKSHSSGRHSARMAELCLEIGAALGLSKERLNTLELAAHIHDVGKIAMPDHIFTKPGKLSEDEWADILKHPAMGADFLAGIDELAEVASIVRHHHEHLDGSGYPDGLKGEAIPYLARILSVADAFEAMTSERPYRKPIAWEEALVELRANAGTQFDSEVVEAAAKVISLALGSDYERAA